MQAHLATPSSSFASHVHRRASASVEELVYEVERDFPQFQGLRWRLVEGGRDHRVLVGSDIVAFRFPRTVRRAQRFQLEMRLLDTLARDCPILIPKYQHRASDSSYGGYPLLSGTPVTGFFFRSCTGPERERIESLIGLFLQFIHAQIPHCFLPGENGNHIIKFGKRYVSSHAYIVNNFLGEVFAKKFEAFIKKYSEEEWIITNLIHGDLTTDHILYDTQKGTLSVLDFGDCEMGDRSFDFLCFWELGEDVVDRVLAWAVPPEQERERLKLMSLLHYGRALSFKICRANSAEPEELRETVAAFLRRAGV
ncbi:hypothetical protein BOSE62_140060 [Bosea sp. 62]|uniref:phosphotransferase family protein n=1 Tax=unclassified Bosea (in: a-proteobacteria) TaxID=2653178 RepID=UPI00125AEBC1|nr:MULTISPECIES: phosphotransferase [unclassified Bosea (in: a-proteobacteria)]CAD5261105.1 hypothetical protein BOSE7B_150061 [Bosea sp. 7B]CAD5271474.1 hypothetical protein BOSE21B_20006 [Bosea sp. 21B]CAD5273614.1 hypothetical protein BOSE46_20304 [Bosea sp. 46]VVT56169.1 hypothetical protein BOS5A_140006 [Bosea sp. EC-HK365B]VXB63903.1 hypothetical protein BOSE62_140060 [Bosea sp. 62]